jgi:hypothetical protein
VCLTFAEETLHFAYQNLITRLEQNNQIQLIKKEKKKQKREQDLLNMSQTSITSL